MQVPLIPPPYGKKQSKLTLEHEILFIFFLTKRDILNSKLLNCQERSSRAVTTLRETLSLEQPDLFTPPHHLKVSPADFLLGPIIGFGQIQNLRHAPCTSFEVLFRTRYFIPLKIETSKERTNFKYH